MITVLQITDCYFKLPDGFSGTLPEALRAVADYVESENKPVLPGSVMRHKDPWLCFLDVAIHGGKFNGTIGLNRLVEGELSLSTKKDCAWEQLTLFRVPGVPL